VSTLNELVLPPYDVTDLIRIDAKLKFSPSVVLQQTEFLSNTLVYDNRPVVYPQSGRYIYTVVNGIKLFLDFDYGSKKMKYLERRLMLQKAGLLLLPLSNEPQWDLCLVIDVGQVSQKFDSGVITFRLLDPFRLLAKRLVFDPDDVVICTGVSLSSEGIPVLDPLGKICFSPSATFPFSRSTSDGSVVDKTRRGLDNFSFTSLSGDHTLTITMAQGRGHVSTTPVFVGYMLSQQGVDPMLISDLVSTLDLSMEFDDIGVSSESVSYDE